MTIELEENEVEYFEWVRDSSVNYEIQLREAVQHLRPKTIYQITRAAELVRAKELAKTQYTGLIKSTADLRYWASVPDWKHRCRRCDKGLDEYGLCVDCINLLRGENRCFECFNKIAQTGFSWPTSCCTECHNKNVHVGSPVGYKEGGFRSGQMRTNYRTDNTNDNHAKIYEERN